MNSPLSLANLSALDLDAVAKAIELDAGQAIPNLRRSLGDAATLAGRVTTPAQIVARRVGRPPLAIPKQAVKVRLDADLLEVLRSTGKGWQTRVNLVLRDSFKVGNTSASLNP